MPYDPDDDVAAPPPRRGGRRDYYDDDDSPPPPRPSSRAPRSRPSPPPYDDVPPPSKQGILKNPSSKGGRSRSNSQVRLREPSPGNDSDGTVYGEYVRHRDGKIDFKPNRGGSRRKPDLEAKNDPRNKQFRDKRNGYESDEGEALRGARKSRSKRDDPDRGDDRRRGPPNYDESVKGGSADMPERPKQRPVSEYGAPLAAGAAGAGAAYGASRSKDRPPPDDRRRSKRYDDYDDEPPPPRQRRPRRGQDPYDDRGYDSERPKRGQWADDPYDDRGSRRRPAGGDRPPRARYDDDYDDRPPRSSRGDRRASLSDRDRRSGRGAPKGGDWKQQGLGLFKEHAMPVIKSEGGKFVKKELGKFLAQQGR